jgi:hypothetical protein
MAYRTATRQPYDPAVLIRSRALPGERELISFTTLLGLLIALIIYQSTSLVLGPQSQQIALSLSLVQQPAEQIAQPIENEVGAAASLFAAIAVLPAERFVMGVQSRRSHIAPASVHPVPQAPPIGQSITPTGQGDKTSGKAHTNQSDHQSLIGQLHGHQGSVTA